MIYFVTVSLIVFVLRVLFRFEIHGKGNLPRQGAFILASNHSSYFDPPILAAGCFTLRLNFLAKEELFRHRFFGWYIRCLGAFPIKRVGPDISAVKESIKRLRRDQALVIFPEGERSKDGVLRQGLPGIAMLATREKIPVVPAFIKGANSVLSAGSKSIRFHKICVGFGKPLHFNADDYSSYGEIAGKIMEAINDVSQHLNGKE